MTIGYIGLGQMGRAIVGRLRLHDSLLVHDRDPAAAGRLAAPGITPCPRPSGLAPADVVLVCLPTSAEVREVLLGPHGLAAAARPGTLVIDQTTGDPDETRALAAELAAGGIDLIDAPVSGGPGAADAGTIAILVGASAAQFSRAEPVLRAISPNLFHAGQVGAGHVLKLANNLLMATTGAATLEAVALAAKNGIDPQLAVAAMMASSGRNHFLERVVAPHVVAGRLDAGFSLGLLHKDVRAATGLGVRSGVPMMLGNVASQFYQVCINMLGNAADAATAAAAMDRLATTRVASARHAGQRQRQGTEET